MEFEAGNSAGEKPASRASLGFPFPFAEAPDIIRTNQKDSYFQSVLLDQFSSILRRLYGARFVHQYNPEARTFTELLYLALTTLIGNRTLGEEYCDVYQVEGDFLRLPAIARRAGYIMTSVLLPYLLTKILPDLRSGARRLLERSLFKTAKEYASSPKPLSYGLRQYILENLNAITSPTPIYAISLAIFYFTGAYYHLSKRVFKLRYIFLRKIPESDQRVGYEVLGFLLALQMGVQTYLHMSNIIRVEDQPSIGNSQSLAGDSAILDGGIEIGLDSYDQSLREEILYENAAIPNHGPQSALEKRTHTAFLDKPRYDLSDDTAFGWIDGQQQRKCTLCLEPMKDPSATTCGHVFCWSCIADWIKEKAECPLCRQAIMSQHVLPLRGV
ncbi:peroxisome biogenesis factor 10 [Agyrium rufum]|nr:peroxisome biogenesis factor 10 [Agyrium rufum]